MLSEISRVLTKKGAYICITYGIKNYRLKYLNDVWNFIDFSFTK